MVNRVFSRTACVTIKSSSVLPVLMTDPGPFFSVFDVFG